MRGIFFANGPSFKEGHEHQWIKLIDEYQAFLTVTISHINIYVIFTQQFSQIFLNILGIEGEEHQGTWTRVEGMLKGGSDDDSAGDRKCSNCVSIFISLCLFAFAM